MVAFKERNIAVWLSNPSELRFTVSDLFGMYDHWDIKNKNCRSRESQCKSVCWMPQLGFKLQHYKKLNISSSYTRFVTWVLQNLTSYSQDRSLTPVQTFPGKFSLEPFLTTPSPHTGLPLGIQFLHRSCLESSQWIKPAQTGSTFPGLALFTQFHIYQVWGRPDSHIRHKTSERSQMPRSHCKNTT